jgi:(p)ppGpp synthase/HD superfamily hydrolase
VIEGTLKTFSQQAKALFKIEIRNRNQLKQIFRRMEKIKGIDNISRVKDYINYPQEGDS